MKREARKERWNGFVDSPKDYWQTVKVSICEGELSCRANRCYQNRGKSVASLVKEAYLQIDVELNDFDVDFYTGDFSKKHGHSFSANQYHENLIPDFNFDSWPEVGVQDYEETCKKILERSEDAPVSNRLFWAGNINTHPRRFEFACIAHQDNNIEFHNTGNWSIIPGQTMLKTGGGQFISLPDHCNYKYLIDIEGNGYSGRVKHLLHTGRPLFYQKRCWNEYWFFDMQPFVHYIPVENDFSDFNNKFNWALENEEEVEEIGKNGRDFAIKNLRRRNAVYRYKNILLRLGKAN